MKKYGILFAVTVAVIALMAALAPLLIPVPIKVNIVPVGEASVESKEVCEGIVEETAKTEVYVKIPVITSEIAVRVGEQVTAGQTLIEVDEASTRAVLAYGGVSSVPALSSSSSVSDGIGVPETITAPSDGTVTNIAVRAGGIAIPGESVVTISDLSRLEVRITIPEDKVTDVQPGQRVTITGEGFRGRQYTGEVRELSPAAYRRLSGTNYETVVDAIVSIDEPDEYLKPNFNVSCCLITPQQENAVTVPYSAVRQDEDGTEYVFVCRHNQAWRADILTGREWSEMVEVLEGLKSGDSVIVSPDDALKNGARVTLAGEEEGGAE